MIKVDCDIDVTGLVCPLPLITMAKETRRYAPGSRIRIVGDDPIFEESALDFCREGGHEVLEISRDGRRVTIIFTLRDLAE